MAENFPNLKKGNRYPGKGTTEGLKQYEPKQTYTKTYNQNGKS